MSDEPSTTAVEEDGIVCDWFGNEIGIRYRLTSVPKNYPDDIGDGETNDPDAGRFTGKISQIRPRGSLSLSPSILSLEDGRNLEITINHFDGLTREYEFITTEHRAVGERIYPA